MALHNRHLFGALIAVFLVSGFSGLIYQSIWTHYLKLFLGHAAYAQALVLATFMGGLALGSWWAAQLSRGKLPLLYLYARARHCGSGLPGEMGAGLLLILPQQAPVKIEALVVLVLAASLRVQAGQR